MFGGSDSGDGLMYTQLKKFISVIVSPKLLFSGLKILKAQNHSNKNARIH